MTSRLVLVRALAAVALVLVSSCGGDPTRIVVVVDSDLALASVHARSGDPGCTSCEHDFALEGPGAVTFPFSFAIAPADGDASREVRLLVEGRDGTGAAVVTRTVRTGFRAGRVILLRVVLEAACRDHAPCEAGSTCIAGECRSELVEPATLPEIEPGTELQPRDGGGVPDGGGVDAGDGGGADAGDGGGADAGDGGGALPTGCRMGDSGPVTIDPDGDGPIAPFTVVCDTSDGAAWVLIANVPSGSTALGYDGAAWESDETAASLAPGTGAGDEGLFLPYWRTPIDRLRIVMIADSDGTMRARTPPLGARTTLRDAVSAPGTVTIAMTPAEWSGLVAGTAAAGACDVSAIGARVGAARVRIGAVLSDDSMCASAGADSWFGVGAAVDTGTGCLASPPTHASGGAAFCVPASQRASYPARALVWGR